MEEALRAIMLADAGISAIVGTRITWGARPQGAPLPAVVLYRIGGEKGYNLGGEAGPLHPRVQVNCLDTGYLGAMNACRAVIYALSGYAGTIDGIYFQGILQDGEPRSLDEPDGATEQRVFGQTVDFIVNHTPQE